MADKLVDDLKRALGDAYTIERELTGGGMSRVFVAKEHALGREVVIKVLPPDLAAGVNRERFRREVQLAARLSHPYIVPLLHAGEHDELLWFTMPYIPGESLRTRLQRSGALTVPEVVKLLRDVVEALAYAHSRGVIHRDIKPGNILYDGQHALVTDFGVAKALNAALPMAGPGHTTSGMAIGTPAYMAPEQLAADPDADQRVDIYAVGLLAYELLSGVSPFAAPSPTATMTAQLTRVPEPLHELRADVPPALSELVQHCLAKSPEDRPPDAQAVLLELDRISGALAADAHRSAHGERAMRSHAPSLPLAIATFVVLALVAGGFWWTQRAGIRNVAGDSNAARLNGDTGDFTASLPVKPMTHQDSLNIAEALRDQLELIDPKYSRQPAKSSKTSPAAAPAPLNIQVVDSLIRAEMRSQHVMTVGGAAAAPAAPVVPGVSVTLPPIAVNGPTARHMDIMLLPSRHPDSTLDALQRGVAMELMQRANRFGQWDSIVIDSMPRLGRERMESSGWADVLVFLGFQRVGTDSTKLLITLRRNTPGTNYGFRVISSDAVYQPTTTAPFTTAIRDANRQLSQLRQLAPGQPWPQDMGRSGAGGPYDPGVMMRQFPAHLIDSLRRMADSLRYRMPRGDSLPVKPE